MKSGNQREERQVTLYDRLYSVAEFDDIINADHERRYELINGKVIEKVPTQIHAYIVAVLTTAIMNYLTAIERESESIGDVLVEARYRMPGDDHNDRIPDLSFVSSDKGDLVSSGPAPYMPDLAIEVQSPDQGEEVLREKARYYLANGSCAVWLVYPARRQVEVMTADATTTLGADDTLTGGAVLPGFRTPINPLFAKLK